MGELPEGWEWKKLGDVLQFSRNGANLKQDKSGNGIPISRIETISYGIINPNKVGYTQESDDNTIQTCKLIEGDLLFSHINSLEHIGKTAIYENNPPVLLHGVNLLLLRPDKKIVDPKFLHILFKKYRREKMFWSMANKSVNQASINQTRLNAIRMPLPPLPIQRQIVAVLEQAEAVKRQRQEADAMTGALLQSVFREMFGEPESNDRGWVRKTLADVCVKFEHGLYVPKERYVENNGVEMIRMADAFYGEVKPGNLRHISATEKESEKYQLLENDLLVARRSLTFDGAAKACKLPKKFGKLLFESSLIRVRPDKTCIDSEYLYQYLNNPTIRRKYVYPFVTSSTISGINQENLKKITVLLPPLALQQQFARIVEDVERIREQQVASGRHIEGLCEGLMQRAFAGELAG